MLNTGEQTVGKVGGLARHGEETGVLVDEEEVRKGCGGRDSGGGRDN